MVIVGNQYNNNIVYHNIIVLLILLTLLIHHSTIYAITCYECNDNCHAGIKEPTNPNYVKIKECNSFPHCRAARDIITGKLQWSCATKALDISKQPDFYCIAYGGWYDAHPADWHKDGLPSVDRETYKKWADGDRECYCDTENCNVQSSTDIQTTIPRFRADYNNKTEETIMVKLSDAPKPQNDVDSRYYSHADRWRMVYHLVVTWLLCVLAVHLER